MHGHSPAGIVAALAGVLSMGGVSVRAADTTGWCASATGSPVIMCDDFDDYCTDPPCDDALGDDTPNQAAFWANWVSDGCLEDDTDPSVAFIAGDLIANSDPPDHYGTSMPFAAKKAAGGKYFNTGAFTVSGASHRYSLVPGIQQLDPTQGSVDGTDTNPLTVVFVLDMVGTNFESASANRYLELTDGSDRAASTVETVDCAGLLRPKVQVDDGLDHNSIAIGVFAATDLDPCSDEGRPLTYRMSVYNGGRWYELKPGIFGGVNGLYIRQGVNKVTMAIKTATIDLMVENTNAGAPFVGTVTVPRVYTGQFAAMHIGNGACMPSIKADYFDDVAVTGGVLGDPIPTGACCLPEGGCAEAQTAAGCANRLKGMYAGDGNDCAVAQCSDTPAGACCLADASCQQINVDECAALQGYFNGAFTSCGTVQCCPIPFADADKDTDVDMLDFAQLQKCVSLGGVAPVPAECACFNRDGDADVDANDIERFIACATGPNIAFDPQDVPAGCTPY